MFKVPSVNFTWKPGIRINVVCHISRSVAKCPDKNVYVSRPFELDIITRKINLRQHK
jgi:hypothetical protein